MILSQICHWNTSALFYFVKKEKKISFHRNWQIIWHDDIWRGFRENLHLSNELLSKQQIIRKSNLSKYKKKIWITTKDKGGLSIESGYIIKETCTFIFLSKFSEKTYPFIIYCLYLTLHRSENQNFLKRSLNKARMNGRNEQKIINSIAF